MDYLVSWLGFTVVVAIFASSRGRSTFGWAIISLIFSPLLAGLLVAVLPDLKFEAAAKEQYAQTKPCPRCANTIRLGASICAFCGHHMSFHGSGSVN